MQKQTHIHVPETNGAMHHAVELVQTGAAKAATGTGKVVRRFPLASIGVALGAGVAIGVFAQRLFSPRPPPTLRERLSRRLASLY